MRSLALSCGLCVLIAMVGCGDADSNLFDTTNILPAAGASGAAGSKSAGGQGGHQAGKGGSSAGSDEAGGDAGGPGGAGEGGAAGDTSEGGAAGDGQAGDGQAGSEPAGASGQGGEPTTGGAGGESGAGQAGGSEAGGASSAGAAGSAQAGTSAGGATAGQGPGGAGAGGSGQAGTEAGTGQAGSGTSGQSGAGQAGGGAGPGGAGGIAGSGIAGSGTAGSGTAGSGTAGSGTAGGGQAGAGQSGAGGGVTSLDTCPGESVTLMAGKNTVTGDTSGLKNDSTSGSAQCSGGSSNDAVYTMVSSAAGRVTLVLSGTGFHPTLYVRKACTDTGNVVCDAGQTSASVSFLVHQGSSFAVFVDGYGLNNQAGPYTLTATLDPAVCGNGTIEIGETCDDGNQTPGDGCDATCLIEPDCKVTSGQDTSYSTPGILPPACSTVDVSGVKITSDNGNLDNDWYCAQVADGQTLTAQTYTGAPGFCAVDPNNTFLEIYHGKPAQAPSNTSCQNNGAVACNDDIGSTNGFQGICSLASYQVPAGQGGQYCVRVTRGMLPEAGSTINYGLSVTIH